MFSGGIERDYWPEMGLTVEANLGNDPLKLFIL